jgi:hypothetical protein
MIDRVKQAYLYYARKRARERAEATIGHGGMQFQNEQLGVVMTVTLTLQ